GNLDAVVTSGFESVITTQLADRRHFSWDVIVSASHGTSKVLDVGPTGAIVSGNTRQSIGYPIDGLFYRTYTFGDANADGRIQASEVVVDSTTRFVGYQVPRDLVSIQNGFDLFARRLRLTALVDYK